MNSNFQVYTIILARKKRFQASQSSGLSNNLSVSLNQRDNDHHNMEVADETDKEREMRVN
jgi:hypothetical protein